MCETGAYAAASLLHLNKRKAYLQAVLKKNWIKPGLHRAEELWTKKYEKLNIPTTHLPSTASHSDNDGKEIQLSQYELWRQQHFAKIAKSSNKLSEFTRFIRALADDI